MARGKKGTRGETEFTKKVGDEVLRALRVGMTMTDAAEFAGVSKTCLYAWLRAAKSKPQRDPLARFAHAVSKGRTCAKFDALEKVSYARDWKAAAWWLGVTDPKNYGPKIRVTLETEFSAALERLKAVLPPETYAKAIDAIAGGDGEGGEGADLLDPSAP